jgi:hypothetical protein
VALGVLVVVLGLLPTAIILATGELIGALPAAVEHGLGSADGTTALLAPAPPSVTGSCSATRGSGSAGQTWGSRSVRTWWLSRNTRLPTLYGVWNVTNRPISSGGTEMNVPVWVWLLVAVILVLVIVAKIGGSIHVGWSHGNSMWLSLSR